MGATILNSRADKIEFYNKKIFSNPGMSLIFFCLGLIHQTALDAQSAFTDSIDSKFEQYQLTHLQEKVFVHTDRSFYLTGEIMWFKAYCLDAAFNRPLDNSKVVYLEILSKEKKAVLQTKILVNVGSGNGSLLLPSYLSSGNYKLRAYTNWMKNFPADFYFEKFITIVNPSRKPDWPANDSSQKPTVNFFPEGGNLVYGLQSNLAFKVTDKYQNGMDCSGILVNQNNDTITSFKSLRFGIGSFIFTPSQGSSYKAILDVGNGTFIYDLPAIYNQGYVISVSRPDQEKLRITVHTSDQKLDRQVLLVAHSRNSIRKALTNEVSNHNAEFLLNLADLVDGISTFTIFNENRQPVCERLFLNGL